MTAHVSKARLVWHEWTVRSPVRLSEHEAERICRRGGALAVLAEDWRTADGSYGLSLMLCAPGDELRALCAELERWFGGAEIVRGRHACAKAWARWCGPS